MFLYRLSFYSFNTEKLPSHPSYRLIWLKPAINLSFFQHNESQTKSVNLGLYSDLFQNPSEKTSIIPG